MREQRFVMRGTRRQAYLTYFEKLGGDRREVQGEATSIVTDMWVVTVGPESEVRMGALRFPEVPITISCDETIFESFVADYRLKFMTAGG